MKILMHYKFIFILLLNIFFIFLVLILRVPHVDTNEQKSAILPPFIPAGKVFRYDQPEEIAKLFNISLAKELKLDQIASRDLINISKKYDDFAYHMAKCREFDFATEKENRKFIDAEEYNDLLLIIQKYPTSTSALTAKLRVTQVTGIWQKRSCRKYVLNLLEEIKRDYPNTWQAIYATKEIGNMVFNQLRKSELQPAIDYHLQHLEEYRKLDNDQNPEFLQIYEAKQWLWWKDEYKSVFTANVLGSITSWAGDFMQDYEQAIRLGEKLIKEYPGTFEENQIRGRMERFRDGLKWTKVSKWFKETYGRQWMLLEQDKLIKFQEDFEKEHNRKSTAEEEIEFLKNLMLSGSESNQPKQEAKPNPK